MLDDNPYRAPGAAVEDEHVFTARPSRRRSLVNLGYLLLVALGTATHPPSSNADVALVAALMSPIPIYAAAFFARGSLLRTVLLVLGGLPALMMVAVVLFGLSMDRSIPWGVGVLVGVPLGLFALNLAGLRAARGGRASG